MHPAPMPRREDLPLLNLFEGCNIAYQRRNNTKVDCHRIVWQVIAYRQGVQIQFFAMTQFISRVLKIIPALRWCSAGSEFITKLYVVAILKLLAVCESGVVSLIKFARSVPYLSPLRQNFVMPRLCYGSAEQVNLLCSHLNRKVHLSVYLPAEP